SMGLMIPSTRMWTATAARAGFANASAPSVSAHASAKRQRVESATGDVARPGDIDTSYHARQRCPQKMIDGASAPFRAPEGRRNGKKGDFGNPLPPRGLRSRGLSST